MQAESRKYINRTISSSAATAPDSICRANAILEGIKRGGPQIKCWQIGILGGASLHYTADKTE